MKESSEKGDGHVPGPGTGKTVYAEHTRGVGAAVRPTDRPSACGWDGYWWGAAAALRSDHLLSPVCHAVC